MVEGTKLHPKVWRQAIDALSSETVKRAILDLLAVPELRSAKTEIQLLRDFEGFFIDPHPDSELKRTTAQFYLTRVANPALDTIFHREHDGTFTEAAHATYAPNCGYVFLRSSESYHSVVRLPRCVRDSVVLRYKR